jgi:hypothetical protein
MLGAMALSIMDEAVQDRWSAERPRPRRSGADSSGDQPGDNARAQARHAAGS